MAYQIPVEARCGIAKFRALIKMWDFDKEPSKGMKLDVGGGYFVTIQSVKYSDDNDGVATRAYASLDTDTYSYLRNNEWTEVP